MGTKFMVQKTLFGWLGFLGSFLIILVIDYKYKDGIIRDLLSFVLVILLIGSIVLLWKACANIKPVALRIMILSVQFSTLILLFYYFFNYYQAISSNKL
jgi:hypothetical protein